MLSSRSCAVVNFMLVRSCVWLKSVSFMISSRSCAVVNFMLVARSVEFVNFMLAARVSVWLLAL
jgi:hypothetical protein